MAQVVNILGRGGPCFAETIIGWNRGTIRKGQHEIRTGLTIENRYSACGRLRAEDHLPDLLHDIRSIVEPSSQTDPTFRSTRIYTPLSGEEVLLRLCTQFGYKESELPSVRTLRTKLNELGYRLRKVKKCIPLKKIPETDAIFTAVHRVNRIEDQDEGTLRISMDTKATVKIGPFSHGGYNRQAQGACDHDFQSDETLTPFGIPLPETGENHLWFTGSRVTADFIVDRLEEMVPRWKERFDLHTLVINADNGPESNGRRTQWLKRLVAFSDAHQLTIQLVYYPPYHSKYSPVERLWGVLENHWRGEIIDSVDKALGLARSMAYCRIKLTVRKISKVYRKGVSVAKKAMCEIEERRVRDTGLKSWSIIIYPQP